MARLLLSLVLFAFPFFEAMGEGFNAVHSPNGIDVWAVGMNGSVFRSFDGGQTWGSYPEGTQTFHAIVTMRQQVWIVGDGGTCYSSTNGGGSWNSSIINGGVTLRSLTFVDQLTGFAAGSNGTLIKTTDGGANWTSLTSGTTVNLNSISFESSNVGYAAGEGGTVLKTVNGGAGWLPVPNPSGQTNLRSVGVKGSNVYITGDDAVCLKSTDGGTSWTDLQFATDSKSDVRKVFVASPDTAFFVGGGGYIRKSSDAGASFIWGMHALHASVCDIYFYDGLRGWACSDKNNVVLRTTDGGATWSMPAGTVVTSSWSQKLSAGSSIGNTFVINPWNKDRIYVALGRVIYMSGDRGEHWAQTATISTTNGVTNSFYISPKDTNLYIVTYTGGGDHIQRSTDRGVTWTTTMTRNFGTYGMPLEMDASHPDSLIFGPEDGYVYRSKNFGLTWEAIAPAPFSSPCDLVVVRDSANIIWVGDSGPGRISRSTDGGLTWNLILNAGSAEIPTIGHNNQNNGFGFATAWSSGGIVRTTNYGVSWTNVSGVGSTWGVDIAKDDPNVVMFGVYGGGQSYLSTNAGATFASASLSGSNYAMLCYDRSTFLAQQSGGVFKYDFAYSVPTNNSQSVALLSPDGGEVWEQGTDHEIRWNANNIANIKIEYATSPSSWQTVATNVPASSGSYAWIIPNTPTNQGRVRISDVSDAMPVDSSAGYFSITAAGIAVAPSSVAFGTVGIGTSQRDTLQITNAGSATLVVSSISTSYPNFIPGRTSFTLAPGASDTLTLTFLPTGVQYYADTLQFNTNAPLSPYAVPVDGYGELIGSLAVITPNGGEAWQYNTVHNITWTTSLVDRVTISYKSSSTGLWHRIAQDYDAGTGSYPWTIPDDATEQARVRVVDRVSGAIVDSSDGNFSITVPLITINRNTMNFGMVGIGESRTDTLRISNSGTAPLSVTNASVDSAGFSVSRSSFTINAGSSDTLTVVFMPSEVRSYAATLSLTSDAPTTPTEVALSGEGTPQSSVEGGGIPTAYALKQNYPNPFNPSTIISYELPHEGFVSVTVYNTLGQEVAMLVHESQQAGRYNVEFRGTGGSISSGIYFYRLRAGNFVDTKKMLLVK